MSAGAQAYLNDNSRWIMFSRFIRGSSLALAISSAGCATIVPQQDIPSTENGPTIKSITSRVTCELARTLYASDRNYDVLISNDVDVTLQLSLDVTDSGSLAPSFTYIHPPFFSFNAGVNLARSREQNYFQKLYYSMRQLDQEIKYLKRTTGQDLTKSCPAVDTNLAGELGLQTAFETAMTALNRLQWGAASGSATDGAFGGYVTFGITKNLNAVGPTWMLTNFKGPGSFAGLSEINTDKMAFAFAQGTMAGKPGTAFGPARNAKAEALLEQININQLATQLGGIRQSLQ
jgi:hypothetical protein